MRGRVKWHWHATRVGLPRKRRATVRHAGDRAAIGNGIRTRKHRHWWRSHETAGRTRRGRRVRQIAVRGWIDRGVKRVDRRRRGSRSRCRCRCRGAKQVVHQRRRRRRQRRSRGCDWLVGHGRRTEQVIQRASGHYCSQGRNTTNSSSSSSGRSRRSSHSCLGGEQVGQKVRGLWITRGSRFAGQGRWPSQRGCSSG